MRRLVILVILYAVMQSVLGLGHAGGGAPVLMLLGFLILAAYSVGELAEAMRLPKVIGYLMAGVVFGPSGVDYVTAQAVTGMSPVSDLAVALIAFLAGSELQWKELRARWGTIVKILQTELGISFVAIAITFLLLHGQLEFLAHASWPEILAFTVLFSSVAVVHSPVVTMAILSETDAHGPVARTSLSVVLLADVAVVLVFTGALALVRALVPSPEGEPMVFSMVAWGIVGAILVGAVYGAAVAAYIRFISRELLIFAILTALLGAEVARIMHVEELLMLLVAGFVAMNVGGEESDRFRHAVSRASAPVFVVFFALSGAKIVPGAIASLWTIAVPVVVVRLLAIRYGSRLGARWAGAEKAVVDYTWYGLISQAGVALGLATVAAQVYPHRGEELKLLFIALIAINEMMGSVMFRIGLSRAGELKQDNEPEDVGDAHGSGGQTHNDNSRLATAT